MRPQCPRILVYIRLLALVLAFVSAASPRAQADLTITMGGDVNFSQSRELPHATLAERYGKRPFAWYTSGIKPLIDGDLNFANIETVVTERTDLAEVEKAFNFQMHPNAVRHLIDLGFNVFSLANNHAHDYGTDGLLETLANFEKLSEERDDNGTSASAGIGPSPGTSASAGTGSSVGLGTDTGPRTGPNSRSKIAYSGVGTSLEQAASPVIMELNGHTIAFTAVGITGQPLEGDGPGVLDFRNEAHYRLVLRKLKQCKADLKVLSIHYGTEAQITLDEGQRSRFRRALTEGDVDLVIGHHPHVVRPIEMVNGKLILYSLGNYLMLGAQGLDDKPLGNDYGLFARAHYGLSPKTGRLKIQALEIVPLRAMHVQPRPMAPEEAAGHVEFLNNLSFTGVSESAVQFNVRADGSGVACDGNAIELTPRAAKACAGIVPAADPIEALSPMR